mgnify:CR=1 FL=1
MKILVIIPIVFVSLFSFGQDIEDQILSNIYVDSAQIREQGIRSMHVYSEYGRIILINLEIT